MWDFGNRLRSLVFYFIALNIFLLLLACRLISKEISLIPFWLMQVYKHKRAFTVSRIWSVYQSIDIFQSLKEFSKESCPLYTKQECSLILGNVYIGRSHKEEFNFSQAVLESPTTCMTFHLRMFCLHCKQTALLILASQTWIHTESILIKNSLANGLLASSYILN